MKILKLKMLIISLLALIVITGCENLLDFSFNSDYSSVTFIVEPEEAGETVESVKVLKSDLDSIIAAEGKDVGNLETVILKEGTVEVLTPGATFDAVESIKIYLEAAGLPKITLASKDNVPEGITSATLDLYDKDIAGYLNSSEYKLTLVIVLDKDLEDSMTVEAKLKYKITVGV
jgi:hypothetical protein